MSNNINLKDIWEYAIKGEDISTEFKGGSAYILEDGKFLNLGENSHQEIDQAIAIQLFGKTRYCIGCRWFWGSV